MPAPCLLIGIGNPGRGDDGLGPALLERVQGMAARCDGLLECLTVLQLQPEHALDLDGRRAVLFADASTALPAGEVQLAALVPDGRPAHWTSHALRPEALLGLCARVGVTAAPAWVLALGGTQFELGTGISEPARPALERALPLVQRWLVEQSWPADRRAGSTTEAQ